MVAVVVVVDYLKSKCKFILYFSKILFLEIKTQISWIACAHLAYS